MGLETDRFDGTIGTTLADSVPHFEMPPHPGDGAPDVIVVLIDDSGFAQLGCYGSDIETPNIDALAANGLQYTNFHVTPLCSPTRAALLTGRNHHTVGMRSVSNFSTGFPHMRGRVSNHAATLAEVLGGAGYATFAVGKWHLCPMSDASAAGPFDQWPLGRGFDRFYGFMDGETDQFHPDLTYDNHRVDAPRLPEEGYHLSADLVDHAIGFIHDSVSIRPDPPSSATSPSARRTPRIKLHRSTSPSTAAASTKAGTSPASAGSPARSNVAWCPHRHSSRRATPVSSRGTSCPTTSGAWPHGCRRRSPRSSTTPTRSSGGWSTICARSAAWLGHAHHRRRAVRHRADTDGDADDRRSARALGATWARRSARGTPRRSRSAARSIASTCSSPRSASATAQPTPRWPRRQQWRGSERDPLDR